MLKRMIIMLLAIMLVGMAALPAALAEGEGYYYVYTENGKGLNVRDTPGGNVVGSLKYGTRIYCYYKDGGNGWALIDFAYNMPGVGYGTYACYVSSRFLQKTKPAAKKAAAPKAEGEEAPKKAPAKKPAAKKPAAKAE